MWIDHELDKRPNPPHGRRPGNFRPDRQGFGPDQPRRWRGAAPLGATPHRGVVSDIGGSSMAIVGREARCMLPNAPPGDAAIPPCGGSISAQAGGRRRAPSPIRSPTRSDRFSCMSSTCSCLSAHPCGRLRFSRGEERPAARRLLPGSVRGAVVGNPRGGLPAKVGGETLIRISSSTRSAGG